LKDFGNWIDDFIMIWKNL